MTEITNAQEMLHDVYCGILAMNPTFKQDDAEARVFEIEFSAPELEHLKATYALETMRGAEDFETAVNLMAWMNKHVVHGNMAPSYQSSTSTAMLDWAYDYPDRSLNCRDQSISLSECLLALGIPAYPIWMFPYSPYDMDNHVVVHTYMAHLGKWVMIDPTWNAYVLNDQNDVLDVFEMRAAYAKYETLHLSADVIYNGEHQTNEADLYDLISYYAKNCFYFDLYPRSAYGIAEAKPGNWMIVPAGFDVNERELKCIDFKLHFIGEEDAEFIPLFEAQKARIKERSLEFVAPEQIAYNIVS
jgi:hypothetical protein